MRKTTYWQMIYMTNHFPSSKIYSFSGAISGCGGDVDLGVVVTAYTAGATACSAVLLTAAAPLMPAPTLAS